jgi:hypothetical protein
MAGYMRWVHKESPLFIFAVAIPLFIGIAAPFLYSPSDTASESTQLEKLYRNAPASITVIS